MPITPRKTEGKQGKDALQAYRAKRNFSATPEPDGGSDSGALASSFVVQKHWASSLHFDFRLELDGTLKSWAVPKGPSLDPAVKRMAVQVEDHPIAYAGFEGTIPTGQYGAGKVIVWDSGHWRAIGDAREGYRAGHLKFELHGHKLQGRWVLVRMKGKGEKQAPWLLIKEQDGFVRAADEFSVVDALPGSVLALGPAQGGPSSVLPALPSEAVLAPLPLSLSPQLATLALAAPLDAENWLLEIKFDGYRMLARIDDATVRLFTRNGHDWSDKLPALKRELLRLALPAGWYDGEIVMLNEAGVPDFGALQRSFEAGTTGALLYYLFDLPYGHGHDLRALPLHARRALLERLLGAIASDAVRLSAVFNGSTASVLSSACQLGLEGVIAKRRDGKYSGSRSRDWLKLKCGQAQSFVVGGYTEPQGARAGFGALLLGKYDAQGELRYAGKVGSGFSDSALRDILQQLAADARQTCPFSPPLKIEGRPHWVEPLWFAEVSFSEWTQGGRIRHAVFRSLRKDKKARSTMREQPPHRDAARKRQATAMPPALKGLRVSHPERVIDVSTGTTKMDLLRYYAQVGALMLKHLKGRPVALARAPEGVDGSLFFQKHADTGRLEGVRQLDPKLDPEHPALIEVGSARPAVSGAVERHRVPHHEHRYGHARRTGSPGLRPRPGQRRRLGAGPGGRGADAQLPGCAGPACLPEDQRRQGPAHRCADPQGS